MPIVVHAKEENEYNEWLAARKVETAERALAAQETWDKSQLIAQGEGVYNTNCAACHMKDGTGTANFPAIKGSEVATGPLDQHLEVVLNGRPGTAMTSFEHRLNDVDLAAVITYQRNAFGNDVGDFLQPSEVKTASEL